MKGLKVFILIIYCTANLFITSGCWNYREIDKLAIVAGVAIDKGVKEKFNVTAELVDIGEERESQIKPKTVSIEGNTVFEAVRHIISESGTRLYWSHAKVVIISKDLAQEGVIQILDWFNRDAETRADIHIFISRMETAKEILTTQGTTEKIISFELNDVLENQRSLSNAPHMEIWRFANSLSSEGISAIATAVEKRQENGKNVPHVMGAAIFERDRLSGFVDGEMVKDILTIQNEIKGGIMVIHINEKNDGDYVALEIFKNNTKLKGEIDYKQNISINVMIETTVAIDEIGNAQNVIEDGAKDKLEEMASRQLEQRVIGTVNKVKGEFGLDVFGFGNYLSKNNPKVWSKVADNWNKHFMDLIVNVDAKVHIKNSAMLSKPLEVGD